MWAGTRGAEDIDDKSGGEGRRESGREVDCNDSSWRLIRDRGMVNEMEGVFQSGEVVKMSFLDREKSHIRPFFTGKLKENADWLN